ncbi:hypothetical protein BX265_6129 [Streptomyces sp. TLI_235]|nr:hypothetical protein [Streptomyces sp. TLI_235]PBC71519.1 hypothetical protein BX265_6129 [Streptomyces sp. TLI_235]
MTTALTAPAPFLVDSDGSLVLAVDYAGAAKFLSLDSPNWLQEHIDELPCTRIGKYVRFSLANLLEILQILAVRPAPTAVESPQIPAGLLNLTPGRAPRPRRKPATASA